MIKNDRQLVVTKEQLQRLHQTMRAVLSSSQEAIIKEMMAASLQADIKKIEKQIERYIDAKEGRYIIDTIFSLRSIGEDLISARIARGLTQEDLARRLKKPPQQVQRYERDHYKSASLSTLNSVAEAIVGDEMAKVG